jgi:hypothetical protein
MALQKFDEQLDGVFLGPVRPYGFIYRITNLITKRCYVGQTIGPVFKRYESHIGDAKRGEGYYLHASMRKHGIENFIIETVATAGDLPELNRLEIEYGLKFFALFPGGYSLKLGDGSVVSEETRKKFSASLRLVPHTSEWNAKISKALEGRPLSQAAHDAALIAVSRPHTAEHNAKISAGNTGLKRTEEFCEEMRLLNLGKPKTTEHKVNISKARKGRKFGKRKATYKCSLCNQSGHTSQNTSFHPKSPRKQPNNSLVQKKRGFCTTCGKRAHNQFSSCSGGW